MKEETKNFVLKFGEDNTHNKLFYKACEMLIIIKWCDKIIIIKKNKIIDANHVDISENLFVLIFFFVKYT